MGTSPEASGTERESVSSPHVLLNLRRLCTVLAIPAVFVGLTAVVNEPAAGAFTAAVFVGLIVVGCAIVVAGTSIALAIMEHGRT